MSLDTVAHPNTPVDYLGCASQRDKGDPQPQAPTRHTTASYIGAEKTNALEVIL